ncbi:hypothetical protein [Bosea sp. BK604]|uniref:hypothetical protein n=1 Tax=Bosea sp. BK604 TaxID=2512180 RepID=UPI001048DA09|nr:hypothetical protein [Bosea sp. BK604]TCR69799.1 hypothetical protein EV560_101197 [Bosea sp. BK604]
MAEESWVWKHRWGLIPSVFLALCFAYGAGRALWYRHVTSASNRPEQVETCALGSYDQAAFRALITRVQKDGGRGGEGCGKVDDPASCLRRSLKERIDAIQQVAGPDMIGRIMAMHALMRANKAVLLAQATEAPEQPMRVDLSSPGFRMVPDGAPKTRRAERFTYALDEREIGFSGPALFTSSRRSWNWDSGRTNLPSGLYAIAEVTILLADPALKYPDDMSTGAVQEKIDYVEAAWSHRSSDSEWVRRPPLPAESVHEMSSLCPRRPAWLDVQAVKAAKPSRPFSMNNIREDVERAMRGSGSTKP